MHQLRCYRASRLALAAGRAKSGNDRAWMRVNRLKICLTDIEAAAACVAVERKWEEQSAACRLV